MTIFSPKNSNPQDFYDVGTITENIKWLEEYNNRYQAAIHGLWEEYQEPDSRNGIKILLERLIHHNQDDRYSAVDYLINVIIEKKFTPENTRILATSDGSESDGSAAGLYQFKSELSRINTDWTEKNLIPTFESFFSHPIPCHIKNIIIFDDFIGSGKTIINKVNEFITKTDDKDILKIKICVFSYVGMKFGIEYAKKELDIQIYCPLELIKGISDHDNSNQENLESIVLKMEKNLYKKWKKLKLQDFSLGYKKSETLYSLYRSNCSNNVFPIFWWPKDSNGKHRTTLFHRMK